MLYTLLGLLVEIEVITPGLINSLFRLRHAIAPLIDSPATKESFGPYIREIDANIHSLRSIQSLSNSIRAHEYNATSQFTFEAPRISFPCQPFPHYLVDNLLATNAYVVSVVSILEHRFSPLQFLGSHVQDLEKVRKAAIQPNRFLLDVAALIQMLENIALSLAAMREFAPIPCSELRMCLSRVDPAAPPLTNASRRV